MALKRLTLARAERFAVRAIRDEGHVMTVKSSRWLGVRCGYRDGSPGAFRCARVLCSDGTRSVLCGVTIETDGGSQVHGRLVGNDYSLAEGDE